jgi:hypothetical protein
LGGGQLWPATADAALSTRRSDAGGSPLPDHGTFELGKRANHLHHHAPGRRRSVDVLRDGPEPGTSHGDPLHDVQHVFQRPGETIELPDHHGVAIAQMVEHAVQLGTVPSATGRSFLEEAPASRGFQRFCLQGVVLLIAF